MKKIYLLMLCFGLLTACQDAEKATEVTKTTTDYPEILSYVPADTPLLSLSISQQQYPKAYQQKIFTAIEQWNEKSADFVRHLIDQALSDLEDQQKSILKEATDESYEDVLSTQLGEKNKQERQKIQAFADKWLSKDLTKVLGIGPQGQEMALYSIDLMPIMRLELATDNQIQAFIEDAKQEFELPIQQSEIDGIKLYTVDLKEMNLQIQVKQPYLVVALTPQNLSQTNLKSVLGMVKPKVSLQQNPQQIKALKQKYNYSLNDVFIFDTAAVADYFINPTKHQSPVLDALQAEDKLSPVCKQELTSLIAQMPRIVGGITKIDGQHINTQIVFETNPEFGKDWSQLATAIPGDKKDNATFYFGFSYDLLTAKNLALKSAKKIADAPFSCEHLSKLNKIGELQDRLNQPLPPFSNNFKGMLFVADDVVIDADELKGENFEQAIKSIKMQMLLNVDHAEGLLAMLQMVAPEIGELEIKADGSLFDLTEKMADNESLKEDMPFELKDLYIAMTKQIVGLSLGYESGGNLAQQVKTNGQKHLMIMGFNAEKYKQLMQAFYSIAETPDMSEAEKMELKLQESLDNLMYYWKNQEIIIDFSEQGLTFDINIEY